MLPIDKYTIEDVVQIFPKKGGWTYVQAPNEYSDMFKPFEDRGLVAITATVGGRSWQTSLLPKGDGTHFIALPKKIRDKEDIQLGNQVRVEFQLRHR